MPAPEYTMSAEVKMEKENQKIPQETSKELRALAHDLSNSLECIMQACYLLNQSQLDEGSKKWAEMIDTATRDAARINRDIRDILRSRS
jgi:nitrogen-specific signal transduction histidine kinase